MTEQGSRAAQQRAADEARLATRRAVIDVARETGARIIERPVWQGASSTMRDVEAIAGLKAARRVELAARGAARGYVRDAREAGHGWREIGEALGLGPDAKERDIPLADAAYDYAAGDPDSGYARSYGRSVTWTCGACSKLISDRGPEGTPYDAEPGHAGDCTRLAEAAAAWDTQWEAEA